MRIQAPNPITVKEVYAKPQKTDQKPRPNPFCPLWGKTCLFCLSHQWCILR